MSTLFQSLTLVAPSLLAASLAFTPAITLQAETADSNPPTAPSTSNAWSIDIVPYLWVAGYEGTLDLPSIPQSIPSTHSDAAFLTHVSAAAMLATHLQYRDWGLFFDGAWVRLSTEGESGAPQYSGTEMKTDIGFGTLALTYRLPARGKLQTDFIAGARVWHLSNEIDYQAGTAPGFTAENSRTWSDPIVGASLRYDLTEHWFGTVLGDVGGFGVGSDISWSVLGGIGYRITNWFSAILGYRYLHVDYDKEGFLMNVNVQGFLLGVGFHF